MSSTIELSHSTLNADDYKLSSIKVSDNDLKEHDIKLTDMKERSSVEPMWRKV